MKKINSVKCFQEKYAIYYDLLYKDKDYESECDFLEKIFKRFLARKPKAILDVACGTGGHIIPLAKRNYEVTGVDASKSMICIAQEKAISSNKKIKFHIDKMQNFKIDKKFDAIITMFSAIDYLTDYDDLIKALRNIKSHLKKGGLFIFDFWNGFATIKHYAPKRIKITANKDLRIKRVSLTELDLFKQIAKVRFKTSIFEKGELVDMSEEVHYLRFFFPAEIKRYLEFVGFKIVKMCRFLRLNSSVTNKDWDITVIAKNI